MIRFGVPVLIMATATAILFYVVQDMVVYPISDTLFLSGQVFFIYGLLRVTNATEVFAGFGYSYRRMFGRRHGANFPKSYFEVKERLRAKKEERATGGTSGVMYLFVSAVMLIASLNLTV
jgi:hypothetical protein